MDAEQHRALAVDLYELTMADAFRREGLAETTATFSLYVRSLPASRGYLVAAGLEQCLTWLEDLHFGPSELAALRRLGLFDEEMLEWLSALRFTGRVRAIPEGTIVFGGEPLLEVDAPLAQAQLAETYLLNQVTLQTTLATKAARCVAAADGRPVVDFALRRTHGVEAAAALARVGRIVGLAGTSNVGAADRFGLPAVGTMAHSFVQAFDSEIEAFRAFVRHQHLPILLVDTYDTAGGVAAAIEVAQELAAHGRRLGGVRIDSGDIAILTRMARERLDDAGFADARIVVSGGLDEHRIAALVAQGAPIDSFGVGTEMGVSADAPVLESVYKLTDLGGRPVRKTSPGKESWPGAKQVWRRGGADDVLTLADEESPGERYLPLLLEVMADGVRRPPGHRSLDDAHACFAASWDALDGSYKRLEDPQRHDLVVSRAVVHLADQVVAPAARASTDAGRLVFDAATALIVVDVQNDFASPKGHLYVDGGEEIIPVVNRLVAEAIEAGSLVVYTQDWHPAETPHFVTGGGPWPVHCVAGTWGAELHPDLDVHGAVVRKGTGGEDGYSGFTMRDVVSAEEEGTGLTELLRAASIRRVVVVGLAEDVCVKATALDARRLGFETLVELDATRAVEVEAGDRGRAEAEMAAAGVVLLTRP